MGGVIVPKTLVETNGQPLVFLAGPIGLAPKWHDEAARLLLERDPNCFVAAPIRELGPVVSQNLLEGTPNHFHRQRAWELHYLHKASTEGCILFWLPGPERYSPEKVYGAMTRMELGEWFAHLSHNPNLNVVIGTDNQFPEMHTIAYDYEIYAPGRKIQTSLAETCQAALNIIHAGPSLA